MAIEVNDVARFYADKERLTAMARQRAALQLSCGIDLDALFAASPSERKFLLEKIGRALRRMRLAGLRQHWSYDLNRHIALRQIWDGFNEKGGATRSLRPSRCRRRD